MKERGDQPKKPPEKPNERITRPYIQERKTKLIADRDAASARTYQKKAEKEGQKARETLPTIQEIAEAIATAQTIEDIEAIQAQIGQRQDKGFDNIKRRDNALTAMSDAMTRTLYFEAQSNKLRETAVSNTEGNMEPGKLGHPPTTEEGYIFPWETNRERPDEQE